MVTLRQKHRVRYAEGRNPPGYVFRGIYLVGKEDLIDFMVEHTDDIAHRYHVKGGDERGS